MSGNGGPIFWNTRPFRPGSRIIIAGRAMTFLTDLGGTSWELGTTTATIATQAGTVIAQTRYDGGQQPMGIASQVISFALQCEDEADYYLLERIYRAQVPVRCFLGDYSTDLWSYDAMDGAATVRTMWPLAYDGSVVTTSTHPFKAFRLDSLHASTEGTDVTVTTTVPSTASGETSDEITPPSLSAGQFLQLRYPAAPLCLVTAFSKRFLGSNDAQATVTLLALPQGVYTT